jgi:hypothetical protein
MRSTISKVVRMSVAAALSIATIPPALAQDTCRQGFVWREAFPGDQVCVTPRTRDQAAQDNSQADARRQPGGGAYGPNTCRSPYVWREARSGDTVCVTVQTRSDTTNDNAQAAARRVASTPSSAPPPPASYKTSEWSSWARAEGVEYRYRWGINTQDQRKPGNVDAMFQVRSPATAGLAGKRALPGLREGPDLRLEAGHRAAQPDGGRQVRDPQLRKQGSPVLSAQRGQVEPHRLN